MEGQWRFENPVQVEDDTGAWVLPLALFQAAVMCAMLFSGDGARWALGAL